MEITTLVTGAAVAASCFLLFRSRSLTESLKASEERANQLDLTNRTLQDAKVRLDAELSLVKASADEQKRVREEMQNQFKVAAHEILIDRSNVLINTNNHNVSELLNPLKQQIETFRTRIEEGNNNATKERIALETKIKELVSLNAQMSQDTQNLTRALKGDAKVQGDWGEMILERILEQSGLTKGREYYIQETITDSTGATLKDEEGKAMRPDVIIRYPDSKALVVDSKVSLTAYARYMEAEEEEMRKLFADQHVASIKGHINNLSGKHYELLEGSLEYKMLFVPNEGAYALAMQADSSLWEYAFSKNILLMSPTNLIAALKLTASLWKQENQNRNVLAIADAGAALYDKMVGFVESMQSVGKSLEKTNTEYNNAFKQLSTGKGNLISRVEKMRELGLKTKKQLPSSDVEE